MKLLYFNDFRLGVLKGDTVVDVTSVVQNIPHTSPGNLIIGVIERFADVRGALERAAGAGTGLPVAQVKIRPPLPKPVNVDCMAVNSAPIFATKSPREMAGFFSPADSSRRFGINESPWMSRGPISTMYGTPRFTCCHFLSARGRSRSSTSARTGAPSYC